MECSELRGVPEGVKIEKSERGGCAVTVVTVSTRQAAELIGKPIGSYITLETGWQLSDSEELTAAAKVLAEELKKLLPEEGDLLFFGLGNGKMTPDSLGPKAAERIFATRHLPRENEGLPPLRAVSAFSPGVISQTGVESAELLGALVARLKPAAVVTADALAARRLARLGRSLQISDSGISPGSGVGNSRARIDESTLGCRVISIGVPTVVDGLTLAMDSMNIPESERAELAKSLPQAEKLIVAPQDADAQADNLSRLIALGFNLAAQPRLDPEFLLSLV